MNWIEYSYENRESHPKQAGRYLIYRAKCNKMHFEQWNGSGWSSSNRDCTHYCLPEKPVVKSTLQKLSSLMFPTCKHCGSLRLVYVPNKGYFCSNCQEKQPK